MLVLVPVLVLVLVLQQLLDGVYRFFRVLRQAELAVFDHAFLIECCDDIGVSIICF